MKKNLLSIFKEIMNKKYPNILINQNTYSLLINKFTQNYLSESNVKTYDDAILIIKDEVDYSISPDFNNSLNNATLLNAIKEIINYGLYRNNKYYNKRYKDTSFILYQTILYEYETYIHKYI